MPRISPRGKGTVRWLAATGGMALAALLGTVAQPLAAGTVSLVSAAAPGLLSDTADGGDFSTLTILRPNLQVSADGRYVVFASRALNLVTGQADVQIPTGAWKDQDIFLYDRVTGTRTLVSHSRLSTARTGNGGSALPALSADGRFVAFVSEATDLVSGQSDPLPGGDVFLYERATGAITLVSHAAGSPATAANGGSSWPAISADGRYVAFDSSATDLVPGQIDPVSPSDFFASDVFVYDRMTGTTALVSHRAGASLTAVGGRQATVSADGGTVVFLSAASDLVAAQSDDNLADDVFLYDRVSGEITLASRTPTAAGQAGNGASRAPSISGDGRYVAFASNASDLVSGQAEPTSQTDLFLFDRTAGTTVLMSHAAGAPTTSADGTSDLSLVSGNGRFVLFRSFASNLVSGLTDVPFGEVYLWDRQSGTTTLISHTAASPSTPGHAFPSSLGISDDGEIAVFASAAAALVAGQTDPNSTVDVFLSRRSTGTTTLVSHRAGAAAAAANGESSSVVVSADGSAVFFESWARDLVDGVRDLNGRTDVFLHLPASGSNALVSRRDPGLASLAASGGSALAPQPSAVSADGRYTVFASTAPNLFAGQIEGSGYAQVFLADRLTGERLLVSRKAGSSPPEAANSYAAEPVMSADGRFVAFLSDAADLVIGQSGGPPFRNQVFLFDRATGAVTLVSRQAGAPTVVANEASANLQISADGRYVAFSSRANNLVAGQVDSLVSDDVFLFDRLTGGIALVTHAPGAPLTSAGTDGELALAGSGGFVAFTSSSNNLVSGQTPGGPGPLYQLFLYDPADGSNRLMSGALGSFQMGSNGNAYRPVFSADGRHVAYLSEASNVGLAFSNGGSLNVFAFERLTGITRLVSHAATSPTTATAGVWRSAPAISADGRYVAFVSEAADLVPGQAENPQEPDLDLFLFDRLTGTTELIDRTAASAAEPARLTGDNPMLSADGSTVVFTSASGDLTPADFNSTADVFLFRRATHPGRFFTVAPCRVLDTRTAGQAPVQSGAAEAWPLYAACGIPSTARAVSVNVTIVSPSGSGFLTLFSGDQPLPPTSTINFRTGQVRANNAVVPLALDGSGSLGVFTSIAGNGAVHVVLDVNGYFE